MKNVLKFNAGIDAAKSKVDYVLLDHLESLTLLGTVNINAQAIRELTLLLETPQNTLMLMGLAVTRDDFHVI